MKKTARTPADPAAALSPEAATWVEEIASDFGITDQHGRLLLRTAGECFCRMRQAQQHIAQNGQVFKDRFGQWRPNPSTVVERDSRAGMLQALKSLNLDIEPNRDAPGRPSGRGGM